MLAVRRSSTILKQSGCFFSPLGLVQRDYHGDPGPTTRSNQKELRAALIASNSSSQRHLPKHLAPANRQILDTLLNAEPQDTPIRPRSSSRNVSLPLRLPNSRFDRNQYTVNQNQMQQVEENPYTTSTKLKRWIDKISRNNNNITDSQIEQAIEIVTKTQNHLVNAPVYNILLGFIGKQRRLNRMWSLYNDMKKRGIRPTTRTFSTLINAYARISHSGDTSFEHDFMPVKDLTHSRVTILFEQSQQHIKKCMMAESQAKEEIGVASFTGEKLFNGDIANGNEKTENQDEINISPTNAYLKYLGRHGLWEDMYKVFVGMDQSGPLSPDTVTYTTLLASLHNIHLVRSRLRKSQPASTHTQTGESTINLDQIQIGPIARGIWDQLSRQFDKLRDHNVQDKDRKLDNELFSHMLRCLVKGRYEDQKFAVNLVSKLWGYPPPGQATLASTQATPAGDEKPGFPSIKPSVQSATSLLQGLSSSKQTVLSSHYATLFLSTPEIQSSADLHFLKSAISALSESGDIGACINILDSYQPPSGIDGWDIQIYKMILQGCRFSSSSSCGDFNTALEIFKRAVQLPEHAENQSPGIKTQDLSKSYEWTSPNGQSKDSRGVSWVKPKPISPDTGILSILLRISMSNNNPTTSIKQILNIINHFGGERLLSIYPGSTRSDRFRVSGEEKMLIDHTPDTLEIKDSKKRVLEDLIDFAKNVILAIEKLGVQSAEYRDMQNKMQVIMDVWSGEIKSSRKGYTRSNEVQRPRDVERHGAERERLVEVNEWQDIETESLSRPRKMESSNPDTGRDRYRGEGTERNERPRSFGGDRGAPYLQRKSRDSEGNGRPYDGERPRKYDSLDRGSEGNLGREYADRKPRSDQPFGRGSFADRPPSDSFRSKPREDRAFGGDKFNSGRSHGRHLSEDGAHESGRSFENNSVREEKPRRESFSFGASDRGDKPRAERFPDRGAPRRERSFGNSNTDRSYDRERPRREGTFKKASFGLKK
ncbi:uncharacterized protein IL334_001139 [Kwoniella shivajii]|uniref:Pentatricopeptide repeat protein n=1 Tax=Kwoniella shivajii TaxID=564305 RepID=A0ABZ1CR41_9TREE|nr:hypothetical protein IL334_001139 [Kwoniella shivajii]